MKQNNIFIILILSLFILNGCRKEFDFQDFDYSTYTRVVGPEGGNITFYANYSNDKKTDVIAEMDVPPGALDSLMVFNLYQYEDFEVASQMMDGFVKVGSKFLYFIPFYESEGYHERGQMELNYHLSVKFNEPITVTYHPLANYSDFSLKSWQEVELYNNYYKTTNKMYKVYRIKIPKIDQWGEGYNLYVNWTYQGYANGYDHTDLSYLINGKWSVGDNWGKGAISMDNWEEVQSAQLDVENDVITFKIFDTDYIYVVARDIYLPFIPSNLTDFMSANFTTNSYVTRASFDQQNYKLYYADNSIAYFDDQQYFLYILNEYATITPEISAFVKSNYPLAVVKKVSFLQYTGGWGQYDVILSGGLKMRFDQNSNFLGLSQYGFNQANLPAAIKTYMQTNHPDEIITNVSMDSSYSTNYTVYLNTNAKVYFYSDFWYQTVYFKMSPDKLPPVIHDFFNSNFPKSVFGEIDFVIQPGDSTYRIETMDNKKFRFDGEGTLNFFEFSYLKFDDLPQNFQDSVNLTHPGLIVTNVTHHWETNRDGQLYTTEYFEIFFSDNSSIYLYIPHNPQTRKKFIKSDYYIK
ncbi:MAG: PepSY-like domain-containing protein [Bacteroidales bacterium]